MKGITAKYSAKLFKAELLFKFNHESYVEKIRIPNVELTSFLIDCKAFLKGSCFV